MTDKEKILAFLEGMSKGCCPNETKEIIINKIIPWINDLPEEPVSENLQEAAMMHFKNVLERKIETGLETANMTSFKAGAKWQKEQLIKCAVGLKINRDVLYYLKPIIHEKYQDFKIGDKVKFIIIKED